ncbi:MAG: hypothetical protein MUQ32_15550 [Chloroflexi bacterium]|nr:hypothetical protein [Chloroflexota bacterium]
MNDRRARELVGQARARVEPALAELRTDIRAEGALQRQQTGEYEDAGTALDAETVDVALAADLREQLAAVERAEGRIARGTYGRSIETGTVIPDERLQAEPLAERTIEEQHRRGSLSMTRRPRRHSAGLRDTERPSLDSPAAGPSVKIVRSLLTIVTAFGLIVGACSGGSSPGSERCDAAFRNAVPRAGPEYGASPLDDAVRQCASVAEWRSAWERIPTSHESRDDPIRFLLSRCGDAVLAPTALCREATEQYR